jgi:hypothetical protein
MNINLTNDRQVQIATEAIAHLTQAIDLVGYQGVFDILEVKLRDATDLLENEFKRNSDPKIRAQAEADFALTAKILAGTLEAKKAFTANQGAT